MPARQYKVQHVAVDDEGLQIGYYDPDVDMKAPGMVRLHTLIVPRGYDYDDEIDAINDAIVYLLNDVGEDWTKLPAPTGPTPEDEEDDE
jgi:hypothetical protein